MYLSHFDCVVDLGASSGDTKLGAKSFIFEEKSSECTQLKFNPIQGGSDQITLRGGCNFTHPT